MKTPPGPASVIVAAAEAAEIFDVVIAGAWRWPDEAQESLQLDSTRPLKLPTILALIATLKQSLIGEQLKEGTWPPLPECAGAGRR